MILPTLCSKHLPKIIASICAGMVLLSSLAFGQEPNPVLASIPENTWVRVDSGAPPNANILAYSGMALDTRHQKLIFFGGGHAALTGNEVWAFDVNRLAWEMMYESDPLITELSPANLDDDFPCAIFYPPGEPLSETRPIPRHTYDMVEFLDTIGETFVGGTYTYQEGQYYPFGCDDSWTFSVETNKWTYRSRRPDKMGGVASAAYDPISGLLYVVERARTATYDPIEDTWTELATNNEPIWSIETVADYDSKRRAVYLFGGEYPDHNELWRYDIARNTWTQLVGTGDVPPVGGGYGMAYDRANDVLLIYKDDLWVYEIQSNEWRAITPAGDVKPAPSGRVHGNFKYDAVNNVVFLAAATECSWCEVEIWAYRYKDPAVVSVESLSSSSPVDFILEQNYPNPFNSGTAIRLRIPTQTFATVEVYDLLGRKVKTLLNGQLAPGSYSVHWHGTNDAGQPVPSGVYVYRLKRSDGGVRARKMVLTR